MFMHVRMHLHTAHLSLYLHPFIYIQSIRKFVNKYAYVYVHVYTCICAHTHLSDVSSYNTVLVAWRESPRSPEIDEQEPSAHAKMP